MTDFDYNGYGLFESLDTDQTEARRAQRKALVTASARVDANLGRFLGAAKSGPEFDERYALVQQEFVSTIREAAEEFGVQHAPVANTIFSHYRKKAYEPEDDDHGPADSPEGDSERDHHYTDLQRSESEDEDETKESSRHANEPNPFAKKKDEDEEDKKYEEAPEPIENDEDDDDLSELHSESSAVPLVRTAEGGDKGDCSECGNEGFLKGGVCGPCRGKKLSESNSEDEHDDEGQGLPDEFGKDSSLRWAADKTSFYPGQYGNSDEELAYLDQQQPINYDDGSLEGDHLQGHHQEQPHPDCPSCQNPGPSWTSQEAERTDPADDFATEHRAPWTHRPVASDQHVSAEGADDDDSYDQESVDLPTAKEDSATGLDGPEPKIDKGDARKDGDTGWSLDPVDPPSKAHPTERIDPTVVMPRENIKTTVKNQVKGIGEQTTETQDLPTSTDFDGAGFAGPNQEQAPHTDQWGNDGQVEPVTNLSSMRWAAVEV
jgi:hypothetical protein